MTEDTSEVLPEDEAAFQLRLWMINEFDREIDGEKKYHKSLIQFRDRTGLENDWPFIIASWGPLYQGFSGILAAYDDLEFVLSGRR